MTANDPVELAKSVVEEAAKIVRIYAPGGVTLLDCVLEYDEVTLAALLDTSEDRVGRLTRSELLLINVDVSVD